MVENRRSAGAVYALKYHLVWCPKYRRKVLVGTVETDLRALLQQKAEQLKVTIEALEIMPDQVHLFIAAPPTEAPHRLANPFKGFTSRLLRQKYPELRSRLPSLWSRSDDMGTLGHVSEKTVKAYLEAQKRS
jgi:putative transposase